MCKVFYYKQVNFSQDTGVLSLGYAADDIHQFTETITFPGAPFALSAKEKTALNQIFRLLHISAGISYYKAFLPEQIVIDHYGLTKEEVRFFDNFYLSGLGEFAIRNNLNLQGKIHFPVSETTERTAVNLNLPYNALIPVGGGKDSCLTMELVKSTDLPAVAVSIGHPKPISDCIQKSSLPAIHIERRLDPTLISLNQSGKVYNGHVPITGILAFILWAAAVLYDKKYVVMSCERSANSGNLKQGNLDINHQYSKSFAFEQDFYRLTQTVTPDFRYFSLLRPLSEAHIAKLFARYCSAYFPVFTSCNKAFKLDEAKRLSHWCGTCDKCRFVFLILAPFIPKETLVHIVGTDPLNDESQLEGFQELLGIKNHKPFECVGEVAESRWAIHRLADTKEWQDDFIVKTLADQFPHESEEAIFTPDTNHLIPEDLSDVLDVFKR